jgi:hypothetical protein
MNMKFAYILVAATLAFAGVASANTVQMRSQALQQCISQARVDGHMPQTVKWRNAVKDCMIDRDFNGG